MNESISLPLQIKFKDMTGISGRFLFLLIAIFVFTNGLFAQDQICDCPSQNRIGKGSVYFSWGYNRGWYSKSDLHFKNTSGDYNAVTGNYDSYDFTVYGVKAKDRPGFKDILRTDLTIPQYVYRLGYYFNDKRDLGIEINFDHTKYVMIDYQTLHVKGTIRGQSIDTDTLLSPIDFLKFEHTNGANFLMVNGIKRQRLLVSANKKIWLSGIVKFGAGIVIPKTDVTLFGQRVDNRFHVAGFITGVETGLRMDVFKYIFLEYTAKGTYANYTNVLVMGKGKANHHFWAFENILSLGIQMPF